MTPESINPFNLALVAYFRRRELSGKTVTVREEG